ncbi:hypothetical protein ACP4OV_009292 [Aristida adscensionis]
MADQGPSASGDRISGDPPLPDGDSTGTCAPPDSADLDSTDGMVLAPASSSVAATHVEDQQDPVPKIVGAGAPPMLILGSGASSASSSPRASMAPVLGPSAPMAALPADPVPADLDAADTTTRPMVLGRASPAASTALQDPAAATRRQSILGAGGLAVRPAASARVLGTSASCTAALAVLADLDAAGATTRPMVLGRASPAASTALQDPAAATRRQSILGAGGLAARPAASARVPGTSASTAALAVPADLDAAGATRSMVLGRASPAASTPLQGQGPAPLPAAAARRQPNLGDGGLAARPAASARVPGTSASTAAATVPAGADAAPPAASTSGDETPVFLDISDEQAAQLGRALAWVFQLPAPPVGRRGPNFFAELAEDRPLTAHALLQVAAAIAMGGGELAQIPRARRSRWEAATCFLCGGEPVTWFLGCCANQVCRTCSRGAGPARCGCYFFGPPVPLQPQFRRLPRRSLPLLRHPVWQIDSVVEAPQYVVLRYHNAEQMYYTPPRGVDYQLHFFFMEGERWTSGFFTYTADIVVLLSRFISDRRTP